MGVLSDDPNPDDYVAEKVDHGRFRPNPFKSSTVEAPNKEG